ncbi:4Fe-4S cluster-binding domain-containing protein [Candidatus Pacearchaeota archaeon]|nr:4Fe-4S cluster-binding domain-containing protein [Candidatus Pacearchaeota archaeon]
MTLLRILTGEVGFERFADFLGMSVKEKEARRIALSESYMPFKVTEYYANLIRAQDEPYRTQLTNIVLPPVGKKPFKGRFDPYGNKTYRQDEKAFLQHKYEKTLLLHIDDFCIANCQFCYKVREIRHEDKKQITLDKKIDIALDYLSKHSEIDNVLFTGGDPASFRKTDDLINLIDRLIDYNGIRVVRFATKGLAYDPERFMDKALLDFFSDINSKQNKQVSIIAQINHPAEISETSREAIRGLQNAGIQIRGQPAIIRGVNDSVNTLIDLQRSFLDNKIISYYLTIFMPVRGVEQYALPLDEAFRNIAESKRHLSGLEKKGILLTSHDFGKFEICGFYPTPENPEKIVLKWHQAAMSKYLPDSLKERVSTRPEDVLILNYKRGIMYCIDHVFRENGLPHFNTEGELVEEAETLASITG